MPIQTGVVTGTAKRTPGWTLHEGKGPRSWSFSVVYPESYNEAPHIFLAVRLIDAVNKKGADFRFAVEPVYITDASFSVKASTWSDSQVWSLQVTWIAIDKHFAAQHGSMIHVGVEKFHKNDHGYTLAEGKGQRQLSRRIAFPTRFAGAPQVLTGFSMLDVTNGKGYDFRVESRSSAIDEYGFDLCAKTCVEGKVWSTQLAWIAIDSRLLQGHAVNGLLLQSNSLKTSVHDHGYSLHRGEEGARHIDRQFGFVSHFSTPPTIATFLTAMDILLTSEAEALPADDSDNGEDGSLDDEEIGLPAAGLAVDARVVVSDENRTTFGFALRTATWGDARVWSATSSWIAIGKPALPRVENDMRDDEHDEEEDEEEEYEEYDHEHPELIEQDEEEDDFLPPRAKQMKRQLSIPVIAPTEPEEEEDVAPEPKKAKLEEKEEEEEAPAPKKVSSTLSEGSECKVCMDAAINTVLIPCGHMALCFDCVTLLRSKGNKNCPICKKNVESVVKTYKS